MWCSTVAGLIVPQSAPVQLPAHPAAIHHQQSLPASQLLAKREVSDKCESAAPSARKVPVCPLY